MNYFQNLSHSNFGGIITQSAPLRTACPNKFNKFGEPGKF
jgi:hypothetical protein